MSLPPSVSAYLRQCGSPAAPPLDADSRSLQGIQAAVVIPALAEKQYLFSTLASLARNDPGELERTLVVCVINNRPYPLVSREALQDNQETLEILRHLTMGRFPPPAEADLLLARSCREILSRGLRLAYLDASSAHREMPLKKGGVGLARKWGMDAGIAAMEYRRPDDGWLLCLDGDSPVAADYLSTVRRFYESGRPVAAVLSYAHPFPADPELLAAICSYETFLRYYVLGLEYAGSPYAFHAIGSTISCSVRGYVAVRGMNRREAGEDFYFLNKLAKLASMGKITGTRVYPSARPSQRVPFGTGQRMLGFLAGQQREDFFYDPRIFLLLKQWLRGMEACIGDGGSFALRLAGDLSPLLVSFLERNDFPAAWERICKTHKSPEKRTRHFQEWFDAFRTMKLVHYLSETDYPAVGLWQAVPELLERLEDPLAGEVAVFRAKKAPGLAEGMEILENLRRLESRIVG